ncbi:MAG: tRNA uridine-5-carboxymethylaminomethyl(34) synthesis enzyme MnmG [Clostridia bacterium]|nr:tRNA uridine-5-carboxymethylaminomethyl(34) synthesis enzyme MnmG [Clostridia bacterium]
MENTFDIIVIGAGHAGCEAALAAARLGKATLLLATNLDTVAFLACNPSIGGTAKGQIVKEIDALGGEMGINADKSVIQLRMLNKGKGPAVYSPRAQVDKNRYHIEMKKTLESTPNLILRQGEAVSVRPFEGGFVVTTAVNLEYRAKAVTFACGVYLKSRIIIGKCVVKCGPNGFLGANALSDSLTALGYELRRFKTGTPARIHQRSVDFSQMQLQSGDSSVPPFSYLNDRTQNDKTCCYLTASTLETKEIILRNKHLAPIYSGEIDGVGPRYCPSIEDKVVRFADKEQHQIFLEPEGVDTAEWYVQGVSSSMPAEIQYEIYRSIKGLQKVEIMRDAYAIEYDCIDPTELFPSLMSKKHKGLFFAGQINGTSGYEEAAGQGLVAGINASRYIDGCEPLILRRDNSYIGVLIDDITTKGTNEPYRMMTGRAEYRLVLRQDNADIRLTQIGFDIGLASRERLERTLKKQEEMKEIDKLLQTRRSFTDAASFLSLFDENTPENGITYKEMLKRTPITINALAEHFGVLDGFSSQAMEQAEINAKYEGYIKQANEQIAKNATLENKKLSPEMNYAAIGGLRLEARQKLGAIKPLTVGQASRISGVSPADINVLIVYLALHPDRTEDKNKR